MSKFDRQTSFGWLINVVAKKAEKHLDSELKKHGLTIAHFQTMMCLWEEEGLTQRQIAEMARVESSTTTRTLDKLENLALVERRADPESRRNHRIFLTPKGRSLEPLVSIAPMEINATLLAPLDNSEKAQLVELLQKVVETIK